MAIVILAPATPAPRLTLTRLSAAALGGGAVDLVYATVVGAASGRSFQRVWQGVASGWLGRSALDLGWASAALGLATHFGIALAMAGGLALVGAKALGVYRRPWVFGLLYGLVLYAVMYGIVLPLRWPEAFPRWSGFVSLADVLAHVGVGLAMMFILRGRVRAEWARAE